MYYGLTLNSGSLAPASYRLNFFLNGLLEAPAYAASLLVILRLGRKAPCVGLTVLAGVALLATAAVKEEWAVVALAIAGKFLMTGEGEKKLCFT